MLGASSRFLNAGRLSVVFALALGAACAATPPPRAAKEVDCVDYWPEARYRNYGYDHIVHVRNNCRVTAVCDVSTNVNPNPVRVAIQAGNEVEVLTYRGAPGRDFRPIVHCVLTSYG